MAFTRNDYYLNQLVRLTAAFAVSGVATDPTAVIVTVRDPSGTLTTPAAVKDSVGNYHYDLNATLAGVYIYGFAGTGACQAAQQATLNIVNLLA